MMKRAIPLSVCAILFTVSAAAQAASSTLNGQAALALAGVIAPNATGLSSADQTAVAGLFDGKTASTRSKIVVTADKIVCRTSNVDITARSCELTFGKTVKTLKGRAASEIYATMAMASVPSDGAAGSIFESLSKLSCTLDPVAIGDKGGGGADCSYEPAN
jgi:hypothetical protein